MWQLHNNVNVLNITELNHFNTVSYENLTSKQIPNSTLEPPRLVHRIIHSREVAPCDQRFPTDGSTPRQYLHVEKGVLSHPELLLLLRIISGWPPTGDVTAKSTVQSAYVADTSTWIQALQSALESFLSRYKGGRSGDKETSRSLSIYANCLICTGHSPNPQPRRVPRCQLSMSSSSSHEKQA